MSDLKPLLKLLANELKCPICLDCFSVPMALPCSHHFCEDCISSSLKIKSECPLCRVPVIKRALWKNSKLDNIILIYEKIAALTPPTNTNTKDAQTTQTSNAATDKENQVNQTAPLVAPAATKNPNSYLIKRRLEDSPAELKRKIKKSKSEPIRKSLKSPPPARTTRAKTKKQEEEEQENEEELEEETPKRKAATKRKPLATKKQEEQEDENEEAEEADEEAEEVLEEEQDEEEEGNEQEEEEDAGKAEIAITRQITGRGAEISKIELSKNQKPKILCTGLNDDYMANIKAMCKSQGGAFVATTSTTGALPATHLVTQPPTSLRKYSSRTLKYLQAILSGCWIVTYEWIEVSKRAGKWAEESLYEIEGDTVDGRRGPFKSRQRMINKEPNLFEGISFYFYSVKGQKFAPSVDELKNLCKLGGGKVVATPPSSPKDNFYILVSDQFNAKDVAKLQTKFPDFSIASSKWFLGCIGNFQIVNVADYPFD